MKTLASYELRSIEQFFQLKQEPLRKAMAQYLSSKYNKVISNKNYIIAVGEVPIALVAHLDTVFKEPPTNIFYDRVKNVMWSPEGLGADDRAGVFSIIQIIKAGYRPTIIFTTDEEIGGLGAESLIKDYPKAVTDLKYIIELDRRGSNDCVFYDCDNPVFDEYIESFDFITNFGSFSDISIICPAWKIAGVNLSIGYYNEHSISEVLYIGQMFKTIEKIKKMIEDISHIEKFDYIPTFYSSYYSLTPTEENNYGWDPSYGISKELWLEWTAPKAICCPECGKAYFEYDMIPVKTAVGTKMYCENCITKENFPICKKCGEFFYPDKFTNVNIPVCKDCKGETK